MVDDPHDWQAGFELWRRGNAEEAARFLSEVARDRPDCVEGHWCLGLALAQCGKAREGEVALRRAIELDPTNAYVRSDISSP